jgi:hypothetical protein
VRTFLTLVLVVSVSMASRGLPQDKTPLSIDAVHNPIARFALERAARGAMDRLERPRCRAVLSDFRDASGRTIQENLDLLGETPRSYLARITFTETLDRRRCKSPGVLAVTSIGGREVFICSPQFWQAYRNDASRVEALLIHEMMHTLGLGENPPTSADINTQVLKALPVGRRGLACHQRVIGDGCLRKARWK